MSAREEEIDFDSRRLCPDGACIGVIGEHGRCKICGRADDGSVVAPAAGVAAEDDLDADLEADAEAAASGDAEPAFDDDRELCPDGTCIGVIGANGRCKVCGRPRGS